MVIYLMTLQICFSPKKHKSKYLGNKTLLVFEIKKIIHYTSKTIMVKYNFVAEETFKVETVLALEEEDQFRIDVES